MGYSSVTVLGDSLVDSGNALGLAVWFDGLPLQDLPEGAPTAQLGYYNGRFSNGFNFADLVANKYIGAVTKPVFPYGYDDPYIGLPIAPFASDPVGNYLNFAYGGAQIRQGNEAVPDLDGQTDAFKDAIDNHADSTGLVLVTIGGNDVRSLVPSIGPIVDEVVAIGVLQSAAQKFYTELSQLIQVGVRHIVVTGVPDVGIIPKYNDLPDEDARRTAGTEYSQLLDGMLQQQLGNLRAAYPTVEIVYASITAATASFLPNLAALYGNDAIYPLWESNLLFFDTVHPTAQGHALLASYVIDATNRTMSGEQLPIAADYAADASIGAAGEVDRVIVSLATGGTYTVQMLGVSSLGGDYHTLADPALRVFGSSGALVGSNDDGGFGLDASISFTAATAGDYVIELTGVGGLTGNYRFAAAGTSLGNDSYTVSHASALILERSGEGFDTVRASVSYALAPQVSVERLSTSSDGGKASINLTGNEFSQTIIGNAGANILNGSGGPDELWGLGGKDIFQFSNAPGPASADRLMDFRVRDDSIWLDDTVFGGMALGGLSSGAFAKGVGATQADDRIIYNSAAGQLFFDPDGVGGADQLLFATLGTNLKLTSADFFVV